MSLHSFLIITDEACCAKYVLLISKPKSVSVLVTKYPHAMLPFCGFLEVPLNDHEVPIQ